MIKEWAKKNNVKLIELAEMLDTSPPRIHWISKHKKISSETADKLLIVTGIDRTEFFQHYTIARTYPLNTVRKVLKEHMKSIENTTATTQEIFDEQYLFASKDILVGNKIDVEVTIAVEGFFKKRIIRGTVIQKNKYITVVKKINGQVESFCHADLICGLAKINK